MAVFLAGLFQAAPPPVVVKPSDDPETERRQQAIAARKNANMAAATAAFQEAWTRFRACDRPAEPEDARWGLWPAPPGPATALVPRLESIPGVDVLIIGSLSGKAVGETQLLHRLPKRAAGGTDASAGPPQEPEDLTRLTPDQVRHWLAAHPGESLYIKVTVETGTSLVEPGAIAEILNHELSAHTEAYADFFHTESAAPGTGTFGTAEEQHAELRAGLPRYRTIAGRYLTGYDDAWAFNRRRTLDDRALAALPEGLEGF
ncbi:hypothetical protein ACWDR0_16385 [Streptomyces sp. NPDC003691]